MQIVDRVQCEVYDIIQHVYRKGGRKRFAWIEKYVGQASLAVTINADGGLSPVVSLFGPFASPDFTLGVGGGLTTGANRIATYDFIIPFKTAASYSWCLDRPPSGFTPLKGEIGFGEWFANVLLSRDATNDPFERPEKLSHKSEFFLDASLRVTPALALTSGTGSGVFSVSRKDTHTLDMVLVYNDPDPEFEKVCVVNLPNAVPDDCLKSRFKGRVRVTPNVKLQLDRGQLDLQLRGIQQQLQIQRR